MPNWKKVIISGSSAELNHITASGNISSSFTGSFSYLKTTVIEGNGNGIILQNPVTASIISSSQLIGAIDGGTF